MNHGRRRIVTMLLIMDALAEHTYMTKHDLVKKLGYALGTVNFALRELRQSKSVHVSSWVRHLGRNGDYTPRFALGDVIDAPRPPRITATERQRRFRAARRRMADPMFGSLIAPRYRV